MLGFLFGTVCLIGLIKVLRRHHGFHHGPFGCGRVDGYGGPHRRSRWFLRALFERLQTTPGQEQVIMQALDRLRAERGVLYDELQQTRSDLSRAVGGGLVGDHTLDDTFARHDRLLAQLRVSFVEALRSVTEALDERQRQLIARWLEEGRGGSGWRWGGPYRGDGIWM
jgi:hypothetical protein